MLAKIKEGALLGLGAYMAITILQILMGLTLLFLNFLLTLGAPSA